MMEKENKLHDEANLDLRLPRKNLWLIAVGVCIIVLGFVLMWIGPDTTLQHFEPDIFTARRIVVAPLVALAGFLFVVVAICYRPRYKQS